MKKTFADYLREDQRLVILRVLAELNSYKCNSSALMNAMDRLGHSLSRDGVKTHLYWLAEQDCVQLEEPVSGVVVATLTERGLDVATGRAIVPGVSRPGA